jgi:hypothetical protein
VTERRVVVELAFGNEPMVFGGELGVDVAGDVGGEPEVAA